jgi:hypothetical protein
MAAAAVLSVGLVTGVAAGEVALEVGETIALEAEQATWREVVDAIGEAVPLALVERGEPPEEPVSLTVEVKTWQGFFPRLLGRESHLLTVDGATGKPTRLVVR